LKHLHINIKMKIHDEGERSRVTDYTHAELV
jgi:hypothetical protein